MQEKKNKRLLILLVTLIVVTLTTLWLKQADDKVEVDKNLFSNYDLQSVDGFTIESPTGKINLAYTGARWKINDTYNADPAMIEVLFATMQQAQPKRPVAASMQDSLAQALKKVGLKISVLSAGKVLDSFYAGGNAGKSQAFFLHADDQTPYLMNIPGYRVYVSGIFELQESGWRDKRIFTLNWRNFEELTAAFPKRPADDFKIALVDQFISIPGMAAVDTIQINGYMDNLLSLSADEFAAANAQLDSLGKTQPLMTISVKDVGGKQYKLAVYPPLAKTGKVAGLIDDKQWAFFAREGISAILRPRNSFGK